MLCGFGPCKLPGELPKPAPDTVECMFDGEGCERFGLPGTCLRQRCILPSGHCSYDLDCDDGNPCSLTRCDAGTCNAEDMTGECSLDGGAQGTCVAGTCAAAPPSACATDGACPVLDDACVKYGCDAGVCQPFSQTDGTACRMVSGLVGACAQSRCTADVSGETKNPDVCVNRFDWYYGVYYRDCNAGLRYRLSDADLTKATDKLAKRLGDDLSYDLAVVLVPVADGGYNIVAHNRHDRSTVEGLVDPSFVAFTVAGFSSTSNWRSRQLQIWLTPYQEGWAIPTSGSRFAMQKGQANSSLGFLGVVDVGAFRKWLQRAFVPLPKVAPIPGVVTSPPAGG